MHVAIVGAGAIGLATAWQAALLGARVTVLEAATVAGASSGRSAGIFNRQTPDALELELRSATIALLERLADDADLGIARCGYVRLARGEAELARLAAARETQRSLGIAAGELVDRAAIARLVPGIRTDDLAGGLYGARDGTIDGHLLCVAFAAAATARGATLHVGRRVTGRTADGVATDAGPLACDRIVNAAGAFAPEVARSLGATVPLAPQRHALCVAHLPAPVRMPSVNEYVHGAGESGLYLRPEGDRRLLCGLHTYAAAATAADPDGYARTVSFDELEAVAERVAHRLPTAGDVRLEAGWAGLYPVSPDGRFIVGPHRGAPEVIAAAGCGGVGLTVSAAVGRLAAEWAVLGEARSLARADELLPDRPGLEAAA